MQRTLIALAMVAAGYVLGSSRAPAQAEVADLLSSIERSQRTIADAAKAIARASEKCAR